MLEDGGFMSVEDLVRAVGCVRASLEAELEKEYSKNSSGYEKIAEYLFSSKKKRKKKRVVAVRSIIINLKGNGQKNSCRPISMGIQCLHSRVKAHGCQALNYPYKPHELS